MMDGSVARPRPLLALSVRLLAAGALSTMAMLVKLAGEHGVHLAELIFWRQALTALAMGAGLAATGRLAVLRTQRIRAHTVRALSGVFSMGFVYGAVLLLPLAEATAISFTTPAFAVLLAMVLFRERIGRWRWAAVALGFAGVLVATRPGSGAIDPLGLGVGLVAAFMVALISYQIQDLNRTEHPLAIVFWFAALSAPVAALLLPFFWRAHDPTGWALIGGAALAGAVAQVLLTSSLRFGSAATIIIMDYTSVLWAVLYGYEVFGDLPPASLWLGAPLIIASGAIVTWRERLRVRKPPLPGQGT